METKEYFEKVMQDFYQHRNGRSLRKYCQMEGTSKFLLVAKWKSPLLIRNFLKDVELKCKCLDEALHGFILAHTTLLQRFLLLWKESKGAKD